MEIYILCGVLFLMVCVGAFSYLYMCIRSDRTLLHKLDEKMTVYEQMFAKLSAKVQELDKELDTSRDAIAEWTEAGKLARKSEEDFNEGLNNILNFQPVAKGKGDEN